MDSTNTLPQIEPSQAEKEVTANENFAAASPAMIFARNAVTSAGLTWGVLGGRWGGDAVANTTVALNPGTTNYQVANRLTGQPMLQDGSPDVWADTENFGRLYKIETSATAVISYEDHRAGPGGIFDSGSSAGAIRVVDAAGNFGSPAASVEEALAELADRIDSSPVIIQLACSDLSTSLTAGTSKAYARAPKAMTVTAVRASLLTTQTGGSIFTVDINASGSTILSTKLTIDNGEKTSVTAATPPSISDTGLADDEEITIDIDQIGDGTAKGLIVTIIGEAA